MSNNCLTSTTRTDPKTPAELQPQFDALCRALDLDPRAPDILTVLKDTTRVPWTSITRVIENEEILGHFGTFRGSLSDDWVDVRPGLVEWQRSGGLARGLQGRGIKSVVIGDLTEEWYLYSIAHPIKGPQDILPNMERYYPKQVAQRMIAAFPQLPPNAGSKESARLYGEIMSLGQVHLPVRLFAEEMMSHGFPVLRYQIGWSPEQHRPYGKYRIRIMNWYTSEWYTGYVTHGCDRLLWAYRIPTLEKDQLEVAKAWLNKTANEVDAMNKSGKSPERNPRRILSLNEDRSISWIDDAKWEEIMKLKDAFL